MARYDWHNMATRPRLRELGRLLREMFGVWVGCLDAEGRAIPIGAGEFDHWKPVCEQFKANSIEVVSGDTESRASCRGSLRQWADQLLDSSSDVSLVETHCHAGLSAWLVPLCGPSNEIVGGLYVSGFLDDEDSERQRNGVSERLESHDLDRGLDAEAIDSVPALEDGARRRMATILERMRSLIEAELGRRETTDDGEEASVHFEGMIGRSPQMQRLFETVDQVAGTDSTVLIEGENGTGKELVARALHRRSPRVDGRFVALNCAAIPEELVESELFGHVEGAFSGAHRDSKGLCEEAHRGTLLLDEIGDMARPLQSKLLRFLQDGSFSPVGSSQSRSVDVRVLCATHRDLERLVERGDFRRDLYFRIDVVRLRIPPLRERKGDIPRLIDHFLSEAAARHGLSEPTMTDACRRRLVAHDWPGNVRELENEIERLVIMRADEGAIDVGALSQTFDADPDVEFFPFVDDMTLPEATERLERKMILDALRETGWNKTRAAERLDVSRRNLIRKVSDYELEDQYRDDSE
jgi:transcriptional regulator with PAS, ATPase and Fis domain